MAFLTTFLKITLNFSICNLQHSSIKNKFKNINIITGDFKETIPQIQKEEFDFIYFDGNHTKKATLENLKTASTLFASTENLSEHSVIFKRANGESEFPFWNNINGPIEDAVWHAGQVVVLRRSAGNPINPKVNVFLGKLNE